MNTLDGLPILDHYARLLAKGKEKHARGILHEFFDYFGEKSPEEILWYMLVMALKNDTDEIEARHRGEMIFFYEYSIAFFKAAFVLYEQQRKQAHPGSKKKKVKLQGKNSV
jgi:hypothetical protein